MSIATKQSEDVRLCHEFLQELFGQSPPEDVAFRFWDESLWPPGGAARRSIVVFSSLEGFCRVFQSPNELSAAEAFVRGDYDIEGDVETVVAMAADVARDSRNLSRIATLARRLFRIRRLKLAGGSRAAFLTGRTHSPARDRKAIEFHYDVSNAFYRLWLDSRMVYSCAYFQNFSDSLERAQEAKLDLICRKLRLKPGMRLLDIGCGWGALLLHAAAKYGVQALGVTLSRNQASLSADKIREAGLQDRCRVELMDYRDLDESEPFDRIASVGMVEHVGEANLPEYFRKAFRLLKPAGAFLNHGIACAWRARRSDNRNSFINRYVFPDGELVPLNTMLAAAEQAGLEIRDVENLREHYALTLRHWVQRLEQSCHRALEHVNDQTYRVWRLYMAASAYGFACGNLQLFQSLLVKPGPGGISGVPLIRADWYS